ncbi:tetratricopeptide repeat protein [Streptomyces sp. QH1-20]|uniref:tetratricopeptide repeat protein n=1 Tax=Streptomyces sp. QH1-20 TaxID=3240934 RepID=UPI00351409B5
MGGRRRHGGRGAGKPSAAGSGTGLTAPGAHTAPNVPDAASVTARDHSIAALTIGRLEYHAPPRAPVPWPRSVGIVPRQADCFQHRAAADALSGTAGTGGPEALCHVLSGTGGAGKTQLAAHHARTTWEAGGTDLLVWVTATDRAAILSAYAEAAAAVTGTDDTRHLGTDDPERAAARFLNWAQSTDRRWLIVLDDVADPADLSGLGGRLALWPPTHPRGRTVVTTRRRDAALPGDRVDVGLFTPAESVAYLTAKLAAQDRREDPEDIAALARDLGRLPLALAQAATYLVDLHLSCAEYRARLADRARTLPDLVPEDSGLPDAHRATVAATWSLSVQHADRLRPRGLARPMLQLIALLDPNGIPTTVLTSPPALAHLFERRTPGQDGHRPGHPIGIEDAADALRCLHRLSLADHTPGTPHQAVRVHALVQRATRETLPETARDTLARTCADALFTAWPDTERDTALARALRANTAALTACAPGALWEPRAHPVLFRTGDSLGHAGLVISAVTHFQDLHATACRHRGPDHADALQARRRLAWWRGMAGDAAGAALAYQELSADELRLLGPDHADTLDTRHALAWWRGMAGDAAGAATGFAELLADYLRLLGPDHLHCLVTRGNLIHWRGEAGDAVGAATGFEELLADHLRVLGPDHPDTLNVRHGRAWWRGAAGDAAGAATAFEHLLGDYLRVLGPDHPTVLTARSDLAHWRAEAGDAAHAAAAYRELLTDSLRVLGPDHPNTLHARRGLARCQGAAGDATGATAALEELMADYLRVLGPDHAETANARVELTRWRDGAALG